MKKATIHNNGEALNEANKIIMNELNQREEPTPNPSQEGNKKIEVMKKATNHNKMKIKTHEMATKHNKPAASGQPSMKRMK